MWKVKVKTWGYANNEFVPIEFDLKVREDGELLLVMRRLQETLIHNADFVITKIKEPENDSEDVRNEVGITI